jgi:hypothetical protein
LDIFWVTSKGVREAIEALLMRKLMWNMIHGSSSVAQLINWWNAIVAAMATWMPAILILTFMYILYLLTHKMLKVPLDPYVILSVVQDYDRPSMLQLVVKNVGPGVVHDISFKFSRPIPGYAWGVKVENAQTAEIMSTGPLIDGIPMLGPGEKIMIDWGLYEGLRKNLGTEPVIVTCSFKKDKKRMKVVICKLDVRSFEKTIATKTIDSRIFEAIEEISKQLKNILEKEAMHA